MDESNSRKPKIGEMVVYVLDSGPDFGQSRPAQIVEIFETQAKAENKTGFQAPVLVNLKVFTDNIVEFVEIYPEDGDLKFSRSLNLEKLPGTWHYLEIVSADPLPNIQPIQPRIRDTPLGIIDEALPGRVVLWNRLVFYL